MDRLLHLRWAYFGCIICIILCRDAVYSPIARVFSLSPSSMIVNSAREWGIWTAVHDHPYRQDLCNLVMTFMSDTNDGKIGADIQNATADSSRDQLGSKGIVHRQWGVKNAAVVFSVLLPDHLDLIVWMYISFWVIVTPSFWSMMVCIRQVIPRIWQCVTLKHRFVYKCTLFFSLRAHHYTDGVDVCSSSSASALPALPAMSNSQLQNHLNSLESKALVMFIMNEVSVGDQGKIFSPLYANIVLNDQCNWWAARVSSLLDGVSLTIAYIVILYCIFVLAFLPWTFYSTWTKNRL